MYRPTDVALVWLGNDSILVAHVESYAMADVGGSSCFGSGIYLVPATGVGMARAVRTGAPVCDGLHGEGMAADSAGRFVVYSVSTPPNKSRLVRLNLASGRLDSLVPDCRIYAEESSVSPDGRAVAFRGMCESRDQPEWAVYVSPIEGGAPRRVYGGDSVSAESPSWSPDGRSLAVILERDSAARYRRDVAVVNISTGRGRVLTPGLGAAWSPDGQLLAYLRDNDGTDAGEIHLVKSDGSSNRVIFRNAVRTTFSTGWGRIREGAPGGPLVWKPDDGMLLFSRIFERGISIWRLDIKTGRVVQLTAPAQVAKRPRS
jgi:Tol biopolymer transport system component